jgi:hypothetical protein
MITRVIPDKIGGQGCKSLSVAVDKARTGGLAEIRTRILAAQTNQSQEARILGARQPQLSEWLSGKKPVRKSARLGPGQKRALVTAVQVDGKPLGEAAAEFGQTVRGASKVLRDWGWDSDRSERGHRDSPDPLRRQAGIHMARRLRGAPQQDHGRCGCPLPTRIPL